MLINYAILFKNFNNKNQFNLHIKLNHPAIVVTWRASESVILDIKTACNILKFAEFSNSSIFLKDSVSIS